MRIEENVSFMAFFLMFYDVLDISATPMKCSCPFPFPETNVLIFENVQMIMFDEELKGKVTGMCEVLILVQSVCKSQTTLSYLTRHPTPPQPTPPPHPTHGLSYK